MPLEHGNWEEPQDFEPAPDPYEQLFFLLDAPPETQAGSAFRTLRAALKQNGLTVAAYLEKKYGGGQDVAGLMAALANERSRANEMDRAGMQLDAELTRAREANAVLRRENGKLQQSAKNGPCEPCHVRECWIAVFAGALMTWVWVLFVRHFPTLSPDLWPSICWGIALALGPLAYVLADWEIDLSMRKHHWVSRTENDWYRAAARKWNEFLGQFRVGE